MDSWTECLRCSNFSSAKNGRWMQQCNTYEHVFNRFDLNLILERGVLEREVGKHRAKKSKTSPISYVTQPAKYSRQEGCCCFISAWCERQPKRFYPYQPPKAPGAGLNVDSFIQEDLVFPKEWNPPMTWGL